MYRDFGYSGLDNEIVHYVSANGYGTAVRVESYKLNVISGGDCGPDYGRMGRVKVKCGDFWAAVHGIGTPVVELTVGLDDGTVIAVTRPDDNDGPNDERFNVVVRSPDGQTVVTDRFTWSDGQPQLTCGQRTAEVVAADGTKTIVDFVDSACEVRVSDGAKLRARSCAPGGVEFCRPGAVSITAGGDCGTTTEFQRCKYLVCHPDMSGYEFVESGRSSGRPSYATASVRTLTRSCFDGRTSGLVDKLLADHLKTIETLADWLNVQFSEVTEFGLEE